VSGSGYGSPKTGLRGPTLQGLFTPGRGPGFVYNQGLFTLGRDDVMGWRDAKKIIGRLPGGAS